MPLKFMEKYDRFTRQWGEWFNWVAMAAIAAMLGVTVIDIVGSKLFRRPFLGSLDIISLLGLLVSAFAIARTEIFKQHVRVDFLLMGLKERTQGMIGIVSNFLALTIIALIIWRSVEYGMLMQASKASSLTLRIPSFPFAYVIALGCIPLFFVLLLKLFESIRKAGKK